MTTDPNTTPDEQDPSTLVPGGDDSPVDVPSSPAETLPEPGETEEDH